MSSDRFLCSDCYKLHTFLGNPPPLDDEIRPAWITVWRRIDCARCFLRIPTGTAAVRLRAECGPQIINAQREEQHA